MLGGAGWTQVRLLLLYCAAAWQRRQWWRQEDGQPQHPVRYRLIRHSGDLYLLAEAAGDPDLTVGQRAFRRRVGSRILTEQGAQYIPATELLPRQRTDPAQPAGLKKPLRAVCCCTVQGSVNVCAGKKIKQSGSRGCPATFSGRCEGIDCNSGHSTACAISAYCQPFLHGKALSSDQSCILSGMERFLTSKETRR